MSKIFYEQIQYKCRFDYPLLNQQLHLNAPYRLIVKAWSYLALSLDGGALSTFDTLTWGVSEQNKGLRVI